MPAALVKLPNQTVNLHPTLLTVLAWVAQAADSLAPSPLAGEGWGEGASGFHQTEARSMKSSDKDGITRREFVTRCATASLMLGLSRYLQGCASDSSDAP